MAFKARRCRVVPQKEIENGKTLVEYATEGDLEGVKSLLDMGTAVDADDFNRSLFYKSQNYMTPLLCAASHGHVQVLKLLIDYGADLDACDRFDVTAVHLAAEKGHLECLQVLLDAGAECNLPTKYSKHGCYTVPQIGGTTPLHLATENGHIHCIKELILNGSDYNMTDELGRTSLYIAASRGHEEAVLTHLQNALGRDILSLPIKETKDTPLHECVERGLYQCVRALLAHGSDTNYRNKKGFSPLHLAVINSPTFNFEIVRELVTNGYNTDVNLREGTFGNGMTPLQYVCFSDNSKQERRPKVAAFLIAYGADFTMIKNKSGNLLLQQELRSCSPNKAILHAIVHSLAMLPSLKCLGIQYRLDRQIRHSVAAEKCTWYEEICLRPRSLQHLCRCTVRKTLGVRRLRKIPVLPLPTTLKEYLLLECDTLR